MLLVLISSPLDENLVSAFLQFHEYHNNIFWNGIYSMLTKMILWRSYGFCFFASHVKWSKFRYDVFI